MVLKLSKIILCVFGVVVQQTRHCLEFSLYALASSLFQLLSENNGLDSKPIFRFLCILVWFLKTQ